MEKTQDLKGMVLDPQYLNYIRTQTSMADDSEDQQFRRAKYRQGLCMLTDAWRRAWPDCRLCLKGFLESEGEYESMIFINVEVSVFGSPVGLLDQFRSKVRFTDSEDLLINYCLAAQRITDCFYDWQQESLRRDCQATLGD